MCHGAEDPASVRGAISTPCSGPPARLICWVHREPLSVICLLLENDPNARIRFEDLKLEELPNGRCTAEVHLAWEAEGDVFTGNAEGVTSEIGVLRCAAEATARALELAVDNRVALELQGITTIKAFDTVVVVVSLASQFSDHSQRVVGSTVIEGEPAAAAVRAVLSATNRLLGSNRIFLR